MLTFKIRFVNTILTLIKPQVKLPVLCLNKVSVGGWLGWEELISFISLYLIELIKLHRYS